MARQKLHDRIANTPLMNIKHNSTVNQKRLKIYCDPFKARVMDSCKIQYKTKVFKQFRNNCERHQVLFLLLIYF